MKQTILNAVWDIEKALGNLSKVGISPIKFSQQRVIYLENYRSLDLLIPFKDPHRRDIFDSLDNRMQQIYKKFMRR